MKAVDTDILVRWITRDDSAQAAIADRVMERPVLVSLSVFLELAWVLAGPSYAFDRATLAETLTVLLDTETITVPSESGVRWAVGRYGQGADIADMIHIAAARGADGFVSFENGLGERAGPEAPIAIEHPL